ncbi:hypothetical protein SDC9_157855 [bioreactor metagenome]|uniref:Uncharacterized protein n=1 Tax=bioreactor metagenome TaxID=1076179 RepID=A0A645F9I0_9ZZZZ
MISVGRLSQRVAEFAFVVNFDPIIHLFETQAGQRRSLFIVKVEPSVCARRVAVGRKAAGCRPHQVKFGIILKRAGARCRERSAENRDDAIVDKRSAVKHLEIAIFLNQTSVHGQRIAGRNCQRRRGTVRAHVHGCPAGND